MNHPGFDQDAQDILDTLIRSERASDPAVLLLGAKAWEAVKASRATIAAGEAARRAAVERVEANPDG